MIAYGSRLQAHTTFSGYPTGYTIGQASVQDGIAGASAYWSTSAAACKIIPTAGSEDPSTFTADSAGTWKAVCFGLKPA